MIASLNRSDLVADSNLLANPNARRDLGKGNTPPTGVGDGNNTPPSHLAGEGYLSRRGCLHHGTFLTCDIDPTVPGQVAGCGGVVFAQYLALGRGKGWWPIGPSW